MDNLVFMSALEISDKIKKKEISCKEVMQAHLRQIKMINPHVNAIVTLIDEEEAIAASEKADRKLRQGKKLGVLHGLPIAHKDLVPTKGIRTTYGSLIYKDYVPEQDGLIVERLKKAGAITIGKTNTPEFGAGCQTFNRVFGETRNPYNYKKTCGGSSGGAAVALACGMIPIADGSDTGGSLRNPANFCNVVGFRPSPGRVPVWPDTLAWFPISVQGPMARTVNDVALILSAISGFDERSPISIRESPRVFHKSLDRNFKGVKVAWSRQLGDLPVSKHVTKVLESQRHVFEKIGLIVEDVEPDFSGADESFRVWRSWRFASRFHELIKKHRDLFKDTVIWDIEKGLQLTGLEIGKAEVIRTQLYHRIRMFMEKYAFIICPVNQVPPFDVKTPWVEKINNVQMTNYFEWMKSCYYISSIGLPSISVPCGFTEDGLPVGIQIVGRHNDDLGVLQLAYEFEKLTQIWKNHPKIACNSDDSMMPEDRVANSLSPLG